MSLQQQPQFPEAVVKLAKFLEPDVVLMTSDRFTVPRDGCYYFYNKSRDSVTVINPRERTMGRPRPELEKQLRELNRLPAGIY